MTKRQKETDRDKQAEEFMSQFIEISSLRT